MISNFNQKKDCEMSNKIKERTPTEIAQIYIDGIQCVFYMLQKEEDPKKADIINLSAFINHYFYNTLMDIMDLTKKEIKK